MMIPAVTPNIPAMVQTDPVIAEHAVVLLKTKYLGCAHVKEQELTVDGIVGMNQDTVFCDFPAMRDHHVYADARGNDAGTRRRVSEALHPQAGELLACHLSARIG